MTIREKKGRTQTRQSPDSFGPNRLPPALFAQPNHSLDANRWPSAMSSSQHVYEVRPRKDHRGVDLISDALPFGRLESFLIAEYKREGACLGKSESTFHDGASSHTRHRGRIKLVPMRFHSVSATASQTQLGFQSALIVERLRGPRLRGLPWRGVHFFSTAHFNNRLSDTIECSQPFTEVVRKIRREVTRKVASRLR
jgi:hypothetical protein